ncbi:MAG: hypothetical protein ACE37F_31345 [Nannocystaceae bacterium]|nr:hypothetical protein [bacterium]
MRSPPSLPTTVGRAERGDNLFRGHSVASELAGRATRWRAVALAVGHPDLHPDHEALLDDMVVCSLAADPHIWPLKVTRIVAAFGRVVPAIATGMLCTAGGFMGWGTYAPAARFLVDLREAADPAAKLEAWLETTRHIPGFGVAFRGEDERAIAFRRCATDRGATTGAHWQALELAEARLRPRGAPPNIAALSAAVLLDVGFSPAQIDALGPVLLLPNYLANAVEGAAQAPELLRRLPADALDDRTPPPRESPRAGGRDR